jgi:hypothetical protein
MMLLKPLASNLTKGGVRATSACLREAASAKAGRLNREAKASPTHLIF